MADRENRTTTIQVSDEEYGKLQKWKHKFELEVGRAFPFGYTIGKIRREWEACTCGVKKKASFIN